MSKNAHLGNKWTSVNAFIAFNFGVIDGLTLPDGGTMRKRDKIRLIKRVWQRLNNNQTEAFYALDGDLFDWYGDGQEAYFCILRGVPIKITQRVHRMSVAGLKVAQ